MLYPAKPLADRGKKTEGLRLFWDDLVDSGGNVIRPPFKEDTHSLQDPSVLAREKKLTHCLMQQRGEAIASLFFSKKTELESEPSFFQAKE